jgi:hypothetical protein
LGQDEKTQAEEEQQGLSLLAEMKNNSAGNLSVGPGDRGLRKVATAGSNPL